MLRQLLSGRAHQSPVAHRSTHHDDRRTIAQPVEGDVGAVARSYRTYEILLPIRARNLGACVFRVARARPLPPHAKGTLLPCHSSGDSMTPSTDTNSVATTFLTETSFVRQVTHRLFGAYGNGLKNHYRFVFLRKLVGW
jgi:hypothetical protein